MDVGLHGLGLPPGILFTKRAVVFQVNFFVGEGRGGRGLEKR